MIKNFFKNIDVKEQPYSLKVLIVLSVLIYIFAIAIRFSVIGSNDYQDYIFEKIPIIMTNDGMRWAAQLREFADGLSMPTDQSPGFRPLVVLSGYMLKVLFFVPVGLFEFYIPAFFASLIVLPIVLIGKELKMQTMSILAAVLIVGAKGFFSRTTVGFFDDDMLSLILPVFILYGVIFALNRTSLISLLPLILSAIFYKWWYPQSFAIMFAMAFTLLVLTLAKERKNKRYYGVLIIFVVAILPIAALYKAVAIGLAYAIFRINNKLLYLGIVVGGIIAVVVLFTFGVLDPIIKPWMAYVFKTKSASVGGIYYYTSFKTIGEASNISFAAMVENIIDNKILFFVGLVGFICLICLNRFFFLMLPMFFMGLLSIDGGARFTPYGSLPFAFGVSFAVIYFADRFTGQNIKNSIFAISALFFGYLGVVNALQYHPKGVVTSSEAKEYVTLGKIVSDTATIYSWWDYGAPIRFFAKKTPNIDSGLNDDRRLFVDSAVLTTSNQLFARNLLVENELKKGQISYEGSLGKPQSVIEAIMKSQPIQVKDPNQMLSLISLKSYQLPMTDKDIILAIPYRMASIYGTIKLFSEIDLASGKKLNSRFYMFYMAPKDNGDVVMLDDSSFIDKRQGLFVKNSISTPIKSMHKLARGQNGSFISESASFGTEGANVIFIADDNYFMVLDDYLFNSAFIQMYFFEKYDTALFEKIYGGNFIKAYRVKRYF